MSPTEIRELRVNLKCTVRELATTLGIDTREVTAWELGEQFPTKKHVLDMSKLSLLGPEAISRKPKRQSALALRGIARLSDPMLWEILIKLTENPDFFEKVKQMAATYERSGDTDNSR